MKACVFVFVIETIIKNPAITPGFIYNTNKAGLDKFTSVIRNTWIILNTFQGWVVNFFQL